MSSRYTDDELLALGIVRTRVSGRGRRETDAYIFKCVTCGRPVTRLSLTLSIPAYCNLCKTDARKKINAARKEAEKRELELNSIGIVDAEKARRFITAADIMRKLGDYESSIKRAKRAYEKFDSVPEAVAAIVLLHAGYRVIAQQPVSDYKVDFLLPDTKTVVEVDGALFHKDASKREIRDMCIKHNLGAGWEIIHVPAEDLRKRPKYFEKLIKARIAKRQENMHS